MEVLQNMWQQIVNMRLTDYLDVIIVAYLLYRILPIFRTTGTMRIAKALVVIIIVAWLTEVFELYTLNFVLSQFLQIGLIAVVVLFQPELRRMMDHLGNMKFRKFLGVVCIGTTGGKLPEDGVFSHGSHRRHANKSATHKGVLKFSQSIVPLPIAVNAIQDRLRAISCDLFDPLNSDLRNPPGK